MGLFGTKATDTLTGRVVIHTKSITINKDKNRTKSNITYALCNKGERDYFLGTTFLANYTYYHFHTSCIFSLTQ